MFPLLQYSHYFSTCFESFCTHPFFANYALSQGYAGDQTPKICSYDHRVCPKHEQYRWIKVNHAQVIKSLYMKTRIAACSNDELQEVARKMLQLAIEKLKINSIRSFSERVPLPQESFDVVYCHAYVKWNKINKLFQCTSASMYGGKYKLQLIRKAKKEYDDSYTWS